MQRGGISVICFCGINESVGMNMWSKIWVFVLLFISGMISAAEITDIRFNRMNYKVQLVLDLDQPTAFQQFSLSNPPRIVLDFPKSFRRSKAGLQINQGAVISVRSGYRHNDMLRVVIDLNNVAKANIYPLRPESGRGHRLVVDVYDDAANPALTLSSLTPQEQSPFVVFEGTSLEDKFPVDFNNAPPRRPPNPNLPVQPTYPVPVKKFPKKPLFSVQPQSNVTVEREITAHGTVAKKTTIHKGTIPHRRDILICIDPGHGGKDPGAVNRALGAREKDVVLAIAGRLRHILNSKTGYRVMMTRDRDIFIPLPERTQRCRRAGGDLFVSIHADAVESREPSGSSVYILSTHGASSQLAKYLANRENAVDLKWGVDVSKYDGDVQQALLNIQQEATLESSHILAQETLDALKRVGNVHKVNVERANFVVLRSPEIPSMLVETAFISNNSEARLLMSPAYQEKVAQGIADGIENYFRQHLPQHMLLEQ